MMHVCFLSCPCFFMLRLQPQTVMMPMMMPFEMKPMMKPGMGMKMSMMMNQVSVK